MRKYPGQETDTYLQQIIPVCSISYGESMFGLNIKPNQKKLQFFRLRKINKFSWL
jgi:hypothetical protein